MIIFGTKVLVEVIQGAKLYAGRKGKVNPRRDLRRESCQLFRQTKLCLIFILGAMILTLTIRTPGA